jgi:hypothetical protein
VKNENKSLGVVGLRITVIKKHDIVMKQLETNNSKIFHSVIKIELSIKSFMALEKVFV